MELKTEKNNFLNDFIGLRGQYISGENFFFKTNAKNMFCTNLMDEALIDVIYIFSFQCALSLIDAFHQAVRSNEL